MNPQMINVRGTSGAGKSTLIRDIMTRYPYKNPVFVAGRKQPLFYELHGVASCKPLSVLGHYESACGGCDTLGKFIPGYLNPMYVTVGVEEANSYDFIFGLVKQQFDKGHDVLFEGLLISGDAARCTNLKAEGYPLTVVALNLTIDECLESVRARRAAAGNTKPFNEENTRAKHGLLEKCLKKLEAQGIPVHRNNRKDAVATIETILGLRGLPYQAG